MLFDILCVIASDMPQRNIVVRSSTFSIVSQQERENVARDHCFSEFSQLCNGLVYVLFSACGDIDPRCRSHGNKPRGQVHSFVLLLYYGQVFLYTVIAPEMHRLLQESQIETLS